MIRGLKFTTKGGPGSGHHGHSGIPGQVGGSAPGGGSNYSLQVSKTKEDAVREALSVLPKEHTAGLTIKETEMLGGQPWPSDERAKYIEGDERSRPQIIINPDSNWDAETIVHELGHHVNRKYNIYTYDKLKSGEIDVNTLMKEGRWLRTNNWQVGLSKWEADGSLETVAGLYRVWGGSKLGLSGYTKYLEKARENVPYFMGLLEPAIG